MAGKTIFESNDMVVRLEKLLKTYFWWPPWSKFFRRDFLIDNDIKFPDVKIAEDIVQTFKTICLAKNLLQISPPLYIKRQNKNSLLNRKRTPEEEIIFWTSPLITGFEYLNEFMSTQKFFKENPLYRLQVLHFFANIQFDHMRNAIKALPEERVYKIFLDEFDKTKSSQSALIAYLLFIANTYRNELLTK